MTQTRQVQTQTQEPQVMGIVAQLAASYGMDARRFEQTLRATVMPTGTTPEQFAAFCMVAKRYGLNPILKEIYAFPGKGSGIQPIVSIDGWLRIINDHPQLDGMDHEDHVDDDGNLVSITTRIWRKDRTHAVAVTEYMDECRQNTSTWKQWPKRMLRHKSTIQAARYAFGFGGIIEPDEADRMGLTATGEHPAPDAGRSGVARLRSKLSLPAPAEEPQDGIEPPAPTADAAVDMSTAEQLAETQLRG